MLVTVFKVKFTLWRHCSANICSSSRRPQDVFKTCLEDIFDTSSAWQFFVFQGVFKRSWRHVLKTSWRHILKTSWRPLANMSWRHLQDVLETNKMVTGISLSNKSKSLIYKSIFSKSISDKSKANPKRIN